MKRVVAITVIMVMVTSLFAFSVSAAGPTTFNDYSATASNNNVSIKLRAVQFKSSSLGTSMLPGGMESVFYVTCEIENNNTDAAILNPILFNITLSEDKTISHIYTYSDDLLIQKETYFKIIPSSDFSYDGMIVVPPETTLYFVGEICTTAQLDQTGQSIQDAGLRGIDFVGTGSSYIVGHGSYPYGSPVDLSELIDVMENVETDLDTIIAYLDYDGSAFTPQTSTFNSSLVDITGYTGLTFRSRRDIFPCYYVTEDIELDSANDQIVQAGSVCYPVCISTYWRNNSNDDYACRYYIDCQYVFPTTCAVQFVSHESNYCDYWYENGARMYLFINNADSSKGYMAAKSLGYSTTWFNVYVPAGVTPNFGTYAFVPGTIETTTADDYHARNVFDVLRNLYKSLVKNSSDDNTEEAQEMNDDIHDAEQVWYDNNTEALEEVGLSNYRFSQSQSSGITQAVTQFQAVWNALGNWTNVYIFILILSISTYIIRHEPTTRVKQYRSSVQAERAERISYYGRKNAESRASSSGSTFKAALRRRK